MESYGFSTRGFNQIILFTNEEHFKTILAANPHMTAIIGADGYTRETFPNVFIAGVRSDGNA